MLTSPAPDRIGANPAATIARSRELTLPGAIAAVLAGLAFPTLVRLRMLDLPLERDEGEYAYAGQLMLQGVPPYELLYSMKFPGIYAAYAGVMGLFGETAVGVRTGLLVVTTITAVLVYVLAARLFGRTSGAVAAASYGLLAIAPEALGLWGHATHFVCLFVVAAAILLSRDVTALRLFGAGVLLGLAVLMKQPAISFAVMAALWVVTVSRQRARDLAALAAGGVAVACAAALALAGAGVFGRFWFWTIRYSREYVTSHSVVDGLFWLAVNLARIVSFAPALWILAAVGIAALWRRGARRERVFCLGFLAAGAIATTPGFYFRPHYFIVLFPAVALIAGAALHFAPAHVRKGALAAAFLALTTATAAPSLLLTSGEAVTKAFHTPNPFVELPAVADYVRARTGADDRIVVLGSEPQVYFYSGRRSATGYVYMYPLMEQHGFAAAMQDEMIREIAAAAPKYLIFVATQPSWLALPGSERRVLDWFARERAAGRWTLEGLVEITDEGSRFLWGEAAAQHPPTTDNHILVLRAASPP